MTTAEGQSGNPKGSALGRVATPASWKPGQSGNPRGRPKGARTASRPTRAALNAFVADLGSTAVAIRKQAVQGLVWAAAQRDNPAVAAQASNALLDRFYGRPNVTVDVNADVSGQLDLFHGLGVADPDRLIEDISKVIEIKAEHDREVASLAPPADREAEDGPAQEQSS